MLNVKGLASIFGVQRPLYKWTYAYLQLLISQGVEALVLVDMTNETLVGFQSMILLLAPDQASHQ